MYFFHLFFYHFPCTSVFFPIFLIPLLYLLSAIFLFSVCTFPTLFLSFLYRSFSPIFHYPLTVPLPFSYFPVSLNFKSYSRHIFSPFSFYTPLTQLLIPALRVAASEVKLVMGLCTSSREKYIWDLCVLLKRLPVHHSSPLVRWAP